MTTLADKSLLSGGDNKPPMLEKHLYDSWKSRMELYMMNRPHDRMILASVEKGLLVWLTITVDGVTRPKEYTELTPAETIQADCDIKAINIILQGLPTEIYALVLQELSLQEQVGITWGNRGLLHVTTAKGKDTCLNNALNQGGNGMIHGDELNTAKVAFMANLSHYGSDALVEVHNHHDNVNNNMINQAVQAMPSSEQSNVKAQQLEPKLYVGDIIEKTNPIVIPDSEETLLLAEESRSKMLLRQKDPIMLEKKVNTTPVDYAALNQLYKDFETRFVPQTELSCQNSLLVQKSSEFSQTHSFPIKQLYDSIKPARIRSKEQCDDLINQVNIKSVEISDLNARIQEKVLVITVLKNDLRKLKGKDLADNAVTKHTIDPEMLKIDVDYLNPRLLNNRPKVGISHETSIARSPEQSGVVERRNRMLIEAARTMLIYAKAPLFLWAEAVATASPEVIAPIAEVVAPEPTTSTGLPSSTTVNQDAPSPSNSQTTPETRSPIISNDVEEENHVLDADT
ncbi:retrovirus-related pol polyprotein from transposon TNT 1-94 [Tanacetum coccineum]|uniref:Retrovirus-related pol polyprotein from transposon TNT 1-94 n=1 Tax=Tanacetum coccineum TaxID=301880 RepID=A0ABQ5BR92_9ASTR